MNLGNDSGLCSMLHECVFLFHLRLDRRDRGTGVGFVPADCRGLLEKDLCIFTVILVHTFSDNLGQKKIRANSPSQTLCGKGRVRLTFPDCLIELGGN